MPRCCGSATCSCAIEEGIHIQIVGSGSAADPFVIAGDVALQEKDNTVFDVALTGLGTVAVPWQIEVKYAASAKLNDLPDVNTPSPTNGQVLGWDTATGQWTARAPTTAAAGTVTHDTSLAGDGSAGAALQVQEDPAGYLVTRTPGLGVTDAGINQMVRKFSDATARASASPVPTVNTLSMLGNNPGQIDYYTGTAWAAAGGAFLLAPATGQELYQMSGAYAGGRLTVMIRNVTAITDTDGMFDAISSSDLAGRAGIMTAQAQPTAGSPGLINLPMPFGIVLNGEGGALRGRAYTIADGLPLALAQINCTISAFVY